MQLWPTSLKSISLEKNQTVKEAYLGIVSCTYPVQGLSTEGFPTMVITVTLDTGEKLIQIGTGRPVLIYPYIRETGLAYPNKTCISQGYKWSQKQIDENPWNILQEDVAAYKSVASMKAER